ncbi:DUF935 family protein [Komagataeibacter xylinus]|uniref:DUF935 domain-containing protein n=1 Tax=Komagataeibacter xylinus TaxID=28448 RepID=UPI00280B543F|nr:DUF935 family protein [Komagataeibacter xylinus]
MAGLIDQWGNPLRAKTLTTPVATADIVGMRPAVTPLSMLPGMDPARMGMMIREADQGNSYYWAILSKELERRDPHVLSVLNTRKRVVAQNPITVDDGGDSPAEKAAGQFVRDWLRKGILARSLYDMLDAITSGFSVHEIDWQLEPGNNRPRALNFRPRKWFEVDYRDGEQILMRSLEGPPATSAVSDAPPLAGLVNIPAEKFVIHRHPSWSGLTIESGLMRTLAFLVMFKMFTMRDWAIFVQNYGLPMRVGRYGPGASEEDKDVLWSAVNDIAGGLACIIPVGMGIEFIEPKFSGSAELHEQRLRYLDEQISKLVLGQTGTTDSKAGAHASGAIHRMVQDDIERADCSLLGVTCNEQVIMPMVAYTFGPQQNYPVISIGRPDEASNQEVTQALQWLGPQGLKAKATELRQRLNLSEPEPGDEVVGGVIAPPPVASPPHELPARTQPPETLPGHAPGATIHTPPDPAAVPQSATLTLHTQLGRVLQHVAKADGGADIISIMTDATAQHAARALGQMSEPVRQAMMQAHDLPDFRARLEKLDLPHAEFANAMAQAMLVANLAGDAAMMEQVQAGQHNG